MAEPAIVNQAAYEVATLTQRMTSQYFAHVAAMYVARDPRAVAFAPAVEPDQHVPVIRIPRRDGNSMIMWFNHHLDMNVAPETMEDFDRIWLIGTLLTVGDALGAHNYFDHEPEAEIIRHLRNGIAHGNKFEFRPRVINPNTGKLKRPANIFRYAARQGMPMIEVDTHNQGEEVLWNWGGPDAVIDCLTVLGVHLWQIAHGLPTP